jgi:hypothetical protein
MNNDTAATLAVMVLAALGIAVLAYVLMPTAAGALECQERPGDHRSYWSYRIVDGDRCWYRGHRVIPKSRLHWPAEPKPKPIKGDPIFNKTKAEVKTVPANEVNAIDAMAQEPPTPFIFLSDKFQGWAMWFSNRVGEVFK